MEEKRTSHESEKTALKSFRETEVLLLLREIPNLKIVLKQK